MKDFVINKVKALKPSGIRRFFEMSKDVKDAIALSVGEPDFDTPWHISEEGVYSIEKGYTFYTSNAGLLELREEICSWLKRKYNVSYNSSEVIVTIGGSEAIDLAYRTCLEEGDEIIMTDPGYVSYEPCALLTGAKVVKYALEEEEEFKIKPEKLEKLITPKTKMLLLNYPNNPTGGIMNEEDLRLIADVCIKHDLLVVSDEIYSELTYEGKHFSIASLPHMKERTLLINGFSKAYSMTGWRLGYICGPENIISQMYKIHQYGIMCAPTSSQFAGLEALRNGDDDILMMKEEYLKRKNYIMSRLKEMNIPCYNPKGAFYCFLNISKFGYTSEQFALRLMKEAKVIIIPGTAFGERGEGFLRLSYAYSLDELKEALNRIEKFLKDNNLI